MNLLDRSARDIIANVTTGQTTASETAADFCDRIEAGDDKVGAFLNFDRAAVLAQAGSVDQMRALGTSLGRLAGLPVAVKDVLCTKGTRTTAGSRILESFAPPFDAHVIERLKAEGAIIVGKLNMDEFAMGSSNENSGYQLTRNPWNFECVPGGSSGGSAAAVAARFAPVTLGSDTGGSIRQPASYCGVVGLKPTYGRVSRYGLIAYGSSLDQIGPFACNVGDAALMLQVIAGSDSRDSTCADEAVPDYLANLDQPVENLKIGIPGEYFAEGLDDEVEASVREALRVLESRGAKLVDISLPHTKYAIATYYLIATAEASSNLARYDGVHYGVRAEKFNDLIDMYSETRGAYFGSEVKTRIMLGTFALSAGYRDAYYIKALKVRRCIKNDFDAAFDNVDVICGPVAPAPAFKIGEKCDDPLAMYLTDIYTISANLTGIPGISVPCGFSQSGMPIGLQIQAPAFAEQKLLRVARMYEAETDWSSRAPAV